MTDPRDPVFHSHITDFLPDEDDRAYTSIFCTRCNEMVHAFNNETMQSWFDTGVGPLCWDCFAGAMECDDFEKLGIR